MLAAAIRASLIEAGEPDTSAAVSSREQPESGAKPTTSKQHHQQHHQQQQTALQPSLSTDASSILTSAVNNQQPLHGKHPQQRRQQQQPGQQHQLSSQEEQLPNGYKLPPDHDAVSLQLSGMAAALEDTESSGMAGQGTPQWGSRQPPSAALGDQLRTACSGGVVFGRSNSAGRLEHASDSHAGMAVQHSRHPILCYCALIAHCVATAAPHREAVSADRVWQH